MTPRDRMVLAVVAVVAAFAGAWFLVLSPKRAEIKAAQTKVEAAQKRLDAARVTVTQAQQAKADYDSDYAAVARLGKAVPVDDNVPSLVYQLQSAARGSKVGFRSLKLNGTGAAAASTPAPTPAPAPSSDKSSSSSSSSSTTSSSTTTPAAPATQAAASALPPGASVGAAGFPTMPFSFVFDGSYFDLENMLHDVDRFITVKKEAVAVHGRLLSIDGFSLQLSPAGFPNITATLSATAYLLPADQGLTGNATPGGPASTATAPTASTASSGAGTPTPPTAAATGVK